MSAIGYGIKQRAEENPKLNEVNTKQKTQNEPPPQRNFWFFKKVLLLFLKVFDQKLKNQLDKSLGRMSANPDIVSDSRLL